MSIQLYSKESEHTFYECSNPVSSVLEVYNSENLRQSFRLKIKLNPLNASPTKWSNTLKQFVGNS